MWHVVSASGGRWVYLHHFMGARDVSKYGLHEPVVDAIMRPCQFTRLSFKFPPNIIGAHFEHRAAAFRVWARLSPDGADRFFCGDVICVCASSEIEKDIGPHRS